MSEAFEFLKRLEATYQNTDIDWEGLLEADYLLLLSGRDNLGAIDIGGHAGRHSQVIHQQLSPSHLMIFEPLPIQKQFLEVMFAPYPSVAIFGLALSNRQGEATFVVKQGALEESGLRQRSFYNDGSSQNLEYITVKIEALDNLEIQFVVDFIKIDTEGGEIDILKGSVDLLRRDRPIISVEYGSGGYDAYGYKPETLFEFARQVNYSIFDLFGNRFTSIDEWKSCVSRFYWDYLLISDEKVPALASRIELIRARAEQVFFPR